MQDLSFSTQSTQTYRVPIAPLAGRAVCMPANTEHKDWFPFQIIRFKVSRHTHCKRKANIDGNEMDGLEAESSARKRTWRSTGAGKVSLCTLAHRRLPEE